MKNNETPLIYKIVRKLIWLIRLFKQRVFGFTRRSTRRLLQVIYRKLRIELWLKHYRLQKLLKHNYDYNDKDWNSRPIRIALIVREGKTHPKSSAFIRLISPLSSLAASGYISYKIFKENTVQIPNDTNICIVQRTAYDNRILTKKLLGSIKKNNIKLIVDTDDAFNLIDSTHPEYLYQRNLHKNLELLVTKADQVWTSTKPLAEQYKEHNDSIYVINNTLDRRIWSNDNFIAPQGPLRMVYMGTATHDEDFRMILGVLDELFKIRPGKFELSIIGISPKELPERVWIRRLYQPSGGAIYPNFVKWFMKQGPFDIGLCPLVESPFNNLKSDIKCLDYIGAGIMPLASNVPAYRTKNLDKYVVKVNNNRNDWVNELDRLVINIDDLRHNYKKNIAKANKYLWNERSSEIAARNILSLLEKLIDKQ